MLRSLEAHVTLFNHDQNEFHILPSTPIASVAERKVGDL